MPMLLRKESHLLSGMALQVALVALLVFAYTQAARQMNYQRKNYLELKEQIREAHRQLQSREAPNLELLKNNWAELQGLFPHPETLKSWAEDLEHLASDRFGFKEAAVEVAEVPEGALRRPLDSGEPLEVELISVRLEGAASTRQIAEFLNSLGANGGKPICPLQQMELTAASGSQPEQKVEVRLEWLVAALRRTPHMKGLPASFAPEEKEQAWAPPDTTLAFGPRREPFQSPLVNPGALEISPERTEHFRLTEIRWDPETPRCVVNGKVLRLGDSLEGARLVVLTPQAALLEKDGQELLLTLYLQ